MMTKKELEEKIHRLEMDEINLEVALIIDWELNKTGYIGTPKWKINNKLSNVRKELKKLKEQLKEMNDD